MDSVNTSPQPTILVVDDETAVRTFAARVLEGRGYHVLVAKGGPEALQLADTYASAIHLLLTDVMLGSENGVELARAILVKRPETAVLYMSGFHADIIQAVHREGSPDGGFLKKPFTPGTLIDSVLAIVPFPSVAIPNDRRPAPPQVESSEAVYRLERAVRCPQCGETVSTLKAVRLLRGQVNFTSTLPRRGRVLVCPVCLAIVPAELSNF